MGRVASLSVGQGGLVDLDGSVAHDGSRVTDQS